MTTPNPLKDEFTRVGGPRTGTLGSLAETWICPTVDGLSDVRDLVAGNLIAFIFQNKIWLRDSADTTSAHDGITVIVTSDSVRFKSTVATAGSVLIYPVVGFQAAPPATAAAGDVYGLSSSPTGAWASHGNAIAVCLVGGAVGVQVWAFIPQTPGMMAYDKSQGIFRSVNASSAWVDGIQSSFGTGTINSESVVSPQFTVQAQTATPPVSPSAGQYWIVGASPTGAFSGHADKVAKCTNAVGPVFAFFTPAEGWEAWNAATKHKMVYASGAWGDMQRPRIVALPTKLVSTTNVPGAGSPTGFGAAPLTTNAHATLFPQGSNVVPNYTLAKSTNRLKIQLRLDCTIFAGAITIAVFKDTQITADPGNWQQVYPTDAQSFFLEFEISVGDVSQHQYNVLAYGGGGIVRQELQFVEIET